ncbi:putative protein kinase [Leptomonas seymouri]|uniref:Protein kinase domain-containing protein n=1 Tax=Leptomonas seymouri TaxID=5684 RepID=A0A0N0P7Y5_LEPSE|nr:putative protein kinase [Leptomonas seymouri]|eukprot:KPI88897.1 putative protein kinase [Leptomonas seymouri]
MDAPSAVEASPTPLHQASSLSNAFEALRQAKAMLRGEQSPFPSTKNTDTSPPGPSTSPSQWRCAASQSNSLDGTRKSHGVHVARSSGGILRAVSMCQGVPAAVALKAEEANEGSLSPDAQPPAAAYRLSEGEGARRREQHVQFSVPPTSDKRGQHSVTTSRSSFSPLPARPPAPTSDVAVQRIVSEVDMRTVQLLQCLTYQELQRIDDILSHYNGHTLRQGEEWGVPAPVGAAEHGASVGKQTSAASWVTQSALHPWDTEPPVQFDVDAQLRYSESFYAWLMQDEGDGARAGSEGHPESNKGEGDANAAGRAMKGLGKSPEAGHEPRATVEVNGEDDELMLSPIAERSLFNSPVHRHHPREDSVEELAMNDTGNSSSRLPPSAGPSILVSPQRPHFSSALRPRIVLKESEGSSYCHVSPPHHEAGDGASPHALSSVSPAERSLGLSASPSRNAASWSLNDFDIGRRIGCGATGRTYLAREKQSKVVVALKCMQKATLASLHGDTDVMRYVTRAARLHMSAGRHCSQIAKLYTFFEDARQVYFTLEYAEEGDLASYAAAQPSRRLAEEWVQRCVRQLALALGYLHTHDIVHGAVAPKHVLLKDRYTTVRLGHFIHATRLPSSNAESAETLLQEGAVGYVAPEVLCGRERSCKSDMWALGVLTYELLCGYLPFEHVRITQVKHLICTGAVYYPQWVSAKAKSFVGSLLCVGEAGRCSAAEALRHPFISALSNAVTSVPLDPPCKNAMTVASTKNSVRKTAAADPADLESKREGSGTPLLAGVCLPISRELCGTSSQAEGKELRMHGAKAAEIALFPHNIKSMKTSSPPSSHGEGGGGHSTSGDNEEASASTSSISNAPTAAVAAAAPSCSSPLTFLGFALPSHSWRSSTQPYGANNGGDLLSVAVTSPHSASSVVNEEVGTRLRRRSSLTATLSDASASLLSTTCAPIGAAGPLGAFDGQSSSNRSSSHRHAYSNAGGPAVPSFSSLSLADNEPRVPCSVTVSSLTAVSPNPKCEWGSSVLDVEVSASSSDASPPHVQFTRHDSSSLLSMPAGVRHVRGNAEQEVSQWPRSLSSLTTLPPAHTAAGTAAGADRGGKVEAGAMQRKKADSGPECAMRLDFDSLSDDDW